VQQFDKIKNKIAKNKSLELNLQDHIHYLPPYLILVFNVVLEEDVINDVEDDIVEVDDDVDDAGDDTDGF
jgi:hypothetical protein